MPRHRTRILLAGFGAAWLLLTVAAGPAQAHGAVINPVSRQAACGPQPGEYAGTPACESLSAQPFEEWDNVRVADVAGRDPEVIPDGQLCSGGVEEYQGLDTPGDGWPVTTMTAGSDFTFTYVATIPHEGEFRLFVTNDDYDPSQPLAWSDLEQEPFLTATDPTLQDGAYRIRGTLPADKTGRHLIYTVWENSDTPDTYYACSDVTFASENGGGGDGAAAAANPEATPGAAADAAADVATGTLETGTGGVLPLAGVVLVLLVFVLSVTAMRRRRT